MKKKPKVPDFDLALIDADSLMYSIAWTTINQRQAEQALMSQLETIISMTEVDIAQVFIKGDNNFRYEVDPEYKANRRLGMDPEVLDRVTLLYSFARKNFIESHGGEADDYVSIFAYKSMDEGKLPVICHIDKDLNMIPGWHFNFRKKEFYFVTPEESFVFMSRQLLTGDMGSDNIPGLKGVGDAKANQILHNWRLSQMKDEIIRQWKTGAWRPASGESTPKERYTRFLKSANCLILRETEDEIRPLTEDEILRKMTWTIPDADYLFHKDRDLSDALILNSLPINCYMETKRPARCKKVNSVTGAVESVTSTTPPTSDSSTE